MAEIIFDCTTSGSNLERYGKIKLFYTSGNGNITITAIQGNRTDGYGGGAENNSNYFTLNVGGTSRDVGCYSIQFGNSSYKDWSGFSAQSFSGLNGNTSVSVTVHSNGSMYNKTWAGTIDAGVAPIYPSILEANVSASGNIISFSGWGNNVSSYSWNIGGRTSGDSSGTMTGFSYNTTYNWSLTVYSSTGHSDSRSGTVTTGLPGLPVCNAPTLVSATDSSLTVAATASAASGASITSIQFTTDDSTWVGSSSPTTITGLQPDTQYNVRASCTDNYGRTMWSDTTLMRTLAGKRINVSVNGGVFALKDLYVSVNGGNFVKRNKSKIKISVNGGNFT